MHIHTNHIQYSLSWLFLFICRDINKSSGVKIVHTSVHGVGHTFVQAAFKAFDLQPPYAVEEQKDPDPEFPTVKYPNPEEGKGVLVGSKQLHQMRSRHMLLFCFCFFNRFVSVFVFMCVCVFVQTLSFALAEREGAAFVLANDPDADRLAVAEKQERFVPLPLSEFKKRLFSSILYTFS